VGVSLRGKELHNGHKRKGTATGNATSSISHGKERELTQEAPRHMHADGKVIESQMRCQKTINTSDNRKGVIHLYNYWNMYRHVLSFFFLSFISCAQWIISEEDML
jgi:hypothetical protein